MLQWLHGKQQQHLGFGSVYVGLHRLGRHGAGPGPRGREAYQIIKRLHQEYIRYYCNNWFVLIINVYSILDNIFHKIVYIYGYNNNKRVFRKIA